MKTKICSMGIWAVGLITFVPAWAWAEGTWKSGTPVAAILSTLVYGFLGILLAIAGFRLFDFLTPFHLEEEICKKQNMAVAILCGAMVLGICLIVAAAVL